MRRHIKSATAWGAYCDKFVSDDLRKSVIARVATISVSAPKPFAMPKKIWDELKISIKVKPATRKRTAK